MPDLVPFTGAASLMSDEGEPLWLTHYDYLAKTERRGRIVGIPHRDAVLVEWDGPAVPSEETR